MLRCWPLVYKLGLWLCIIRARLHTLAEKQRPQVPRKLLEDWSSAQVLQPVGRVALANVCQLGVQGHQLVHVGPELRRLTVWHLQ